MARGEEKEKEWMHEVCHAPLGKSRVKRFSG